MLKHKTVPDGNEASIRDRFLGFLKIQPSGDKKYRIEGEASIANKLDSSHFQNNQGASHEQGGTQPAVRAAARSPNEVFG
jgi:hypothetical protein